MKKLLNPLLIFVIFLNFSPFVYANMALPESYYYGSSLGLLLVMLLSDGIVLWLALKFIRVKIKLAKYFVALIVTVILGIVADIFSLIITNVLLNAFYPIFSRYHYEVAISNYTFLFSPSEFYRLGTYLNNFSSHFPEYVPPVGLSLLIISAFICIAGSNIIHKFILRTNTKQALIIALFLGIFTNPGWGLYSYTVIAWIIVLGTIFIGIKKKTSKNRHEDEKIV